MCLCVSLCEKEEVEVLRQVVAQLNDEQTALARGLTSGVFDRTDSIRQRARHRQVTKAILCWLTVRQNFERSPLTVCNDPTTLRNTQESLIQRYRPGS